LNTTNNISITALGFSGGFLLHSEAKRLPPTVGAKRIY
jgi:hypothetical protein